MKIVLLGAGNVATSLGIALVKAQHEVLQVYSRTISSAQCLANSIGAKAINAVALLSEEADVYLIAIKDNAVAALLEKLPDRLSHKIFAHTGGTLPMEVFKGQCLHYGVVYPLQTFSRSIALDFKEIPIFVEASDERTLSDLIELSQTISTRVEPLSSHKRIYLHLSAVWACNFVNHCYTIASDVLESQALPFDVLRPLISETANKAMRVPPYLAQTGPAVRKDTQTMEKHIKLLEYAPELQQLYKMLSDSIDSHHDKLLKKERI